eukprot:1305699-Karenia_brevis.AAC.1
MKVKTEQAMHQVARKPEELTSVLHKILQRKFPPNHDKQKEVDWEGKMQQTTPCEWRDSDPFRHMKKQDPNQEHWAHLETILDGDFDERSVDDEHRFTSDQVRETTAELHGIMDQEFAEQEACFKQCIADKDTATFIAVWSRAFEDSVEKLARKYEVADKLEKGHGK